MLGNVRSHRVSRFPADGWPVGCNIIGPLKNEEFRCLVVLHDGTFIRRFHLDDLEFVQGYLAGFLDKMPRFLPDLLTIEVRIYSSDIPF